MNSGAELSCHLPFALKEVTTSCFVTGLQGLRNRTKATPSAAAKDKAAKFCFQPRSTGEKGVFVSDVWLGNPISKEKFDSDQERVRSFAAADGVASSLFF